MTNYTRTITVNATPAKAFWALTEGIGEWWTTPDAPMTKLGDTSKFTFPPGKSHWTFEATELQPDKSVEMVCVDALHIHEGQPTEIETEWLNTRVRWEIAADDDTTSITIEHHGLIPGLLCYEVCENGWDHFFLNSLPALLNTGTGNPHRVPEG